MLHCLMFHYLMFHYLVIHYFLVALVVVVLFNFVLFYYSIIKCFTILLLDYINVAPVDIALLMFNYLNVVLSFVAPFNVVLY